ncbi:MAG: 30S ribosomal protein S26e [Candidatus Thorarchaeota archaeon]
MPKKRKSGGRSKGAKGASGYVQCSACNKTVPRDKAKKQTKTRSFVDPVIAKELRQTGAQISRSTTISYLCINCAVHRGVSSIRSVKDRKVTRSPRRF